jgi:hypothetical protein
MIADWRKQIGERRSLNPKGHEGRKTLPRINTDNTDLKKIGEKLRQEGIAPRMNASGSERSPQGLKPAIYRRVPQA